MRDLEGDGYVQEKRYEVDTTEPSSNRMTDLKKKRKSVESRRKFLQILAAN